MKVSLCFTTFNDMRRIRPFMDAIHKQTRQPDEIVVVDGGSMDDTREMFGPSVRVILDESCNIKHSPSPVARGRNRAIALATGEVIVVTNVDCIPEEHWIEKLIEPFDNFAMVVGGMVRSGAQTKFERISATIILPKREGLEYDPSSRNIAFTKGIWQEVGGYPEVTLTAEDTFFNHKLREWGVMFRFAPEAVVTWRPRSTLGGLLKQAYRYSKGDGLCGLNFPMHARKLVKFGMIFSGLGFVCWWIWRVL